MMRNAYTARRKSRRGFTLVEVIVSAIIVAFMGAVGFFSYANIRNANIDSRERDTAKIFAQRTMERVRADAQTGFDMLTTANENDVLTTDPGETMVVSQFPDHNRTITIVDQGTPELKRVQVNIVWNHEQNPAAPRNYQLVAILTRPGNLLPGNIQGNVSDSATGTLVAGALVTINNLVTGETHTIATNDKGFYTFANILSGAFTLTPGNWNLSATASGYDPYVHPANPVNVPANTNVIVNFGMVHLQTGMIRVNVFEDVTSNPLSQYVSLYQGGAFVARNDSTYGAGTFEHTVNFPDSNPQFFTLVTGKGKPGDITQEEGSYPYLANGHCGRFNACESWANALNYKGWSSAAFLPLATITGQNIAYDTRTAPVVCGINWPQWAAGPDTIQLRPGGTTTVNVYLIPIPIAKYNGTILDSLGAVMPNSKISVRWHNGYAYSSVPIDVPTGVFVNVEVPAEQELFPNATGYYAQALASANVTRMCCCNVACAQTLSSGWQPRGPFYEGGSLTQDISLSPSTDNICGDAKGNVDEVNDGPVAGATVTIAGLTATTNGAGAYEFKCSGEGYRIPQGAYAVNASRPGFYAFSSSGNSFYAPRGSIQIIANNTKVYAPPIRLLRQGIGTVTGRVVQLIGGVPTGVAGITVKLDWFSDGSDNQSVNTAANGTFTFNNASEAWPPSSVVGDLSFVQGPRKHTAKVPDTTTYIGAWKANIDLQAGDTLDAGDIVVSARSGT